MSLRLSEGLGRAARMRLEPHVLDALPVRRQVLPLLETIKVVDADLSDWSWFGHAQVYGDSSASFGVWFKCPPVRHSAALGAEVEAQRVAADVCGGLTFNPDVLALVAIGPEYTVSATGCAVASRR